VFACVCLFLLFSLLSFASDLCICIPTSTCNCRIARSGGSSPFKNAVPVPYWRIYPIQHKSSTVLVSSGETRTRLPDPSSMPIRAAGDINWRRTVWEMISDHLCSWTWKALCCAVVLYCTIRSERAILYYIQYGTHSLRSYHAIDYGLPPPLPTLDWLCTDFVLVRPRKSLQ